MNRACAVVVILLLGWAQPDCVIASLRDPQMSYSVTSADGMHRLVMIVPEPPDLKEYPWLVDTLRDEYPQSGCYAIGSHEPLWTFEEYRECCCLSDDGRYLVAYNLYGDTELPPEVDDEWYEPDVWGVKFYDRGCEIASYDIVDLVDYPMLVQMTTAGWYFVWIDEEQDEAVHIQGHRFFLRTSTHASFVFDITDGEILRESRFWRHLSTTGKVLLTTVIGTVLLRWHVRRTSGGNDHATSWIKNHLTPIETRRWFAFSLRQMVALTTMCAMLVASLQLAPPRGVPQFVVLLSSFVLALAATVVWLRGKNRSAPRRWAMRALTLACWLPFYLLSLAPVMAVLDRINAAWDVRLAVLYVVYYPIIQLESVFRRLAPDVVRWYFDGWSYW
ncbi:MAG: hypothetical protein R3C10_17035 [Pirellulales bacterium]